MSPPKSPQRPPAPSAPVASPPRVVPHQPLVSATSPFTAPLLTLEQRLEQLAAITAEAAACTACRLHLGRTNIVSGEGNPMAELMFIGEGPGESEDLQGRPFVGRSGELLTKIIEAMTFKREEVFIGNVVKCRPPENRKPHADEMETCLPYLARQVEIIRPKVIVTLGVTALTGLLPEHIKTPIGKIRGQWLEYRGIPVMPTLHPAFLLRQPTQKRLVWEDMQLVMAKFGRQPEKP
ncbi:MAG: uracil-DNA glycosylase [Candidatus Sumerlaeia bacterium]|nr:uracil-DNA glycosylase [Candidatus Sumerlaeia bacterium]